MKYIIIALLLSAPCFAGDEAVDNTPLKECIASGGRPTIGTLGITCDYPDIQGHQVASTNPTGDPCPGQYEYGIKEEGYHLFCFGSKQQ